MASSVPALAVMLSRAAMPGKKGADRNIHLESILLHIIEIASGRFNEVADDKGHGGSYRICVQPRMDLVDAKQNCSLPHRLSSPKRRGPIAEQEYVL